MNLMQYFFLFCVAIVSNVFAQELNGLCLNVLGLSIGCQSSGPINTESEHVRNTIANINQIYKQYEQFGDYQYAKLTLKNGYITFVQSLSNCEKRSMEAFSITEELLNLNQSTAAKEAMQQKIKLAQEDLYDAGVQILQCFGDGMALSDESKRQGLGEASQMLQHLGLRLVNQMDTSISSVNQGINVGRAPGQQAINAARQALKAVFAHYYQVNKNSFQKAVEFISYDQKMPPQTFQLVNPNAEVTARDPDASSVIKIIKKFAEDSIQNGASPDRVNKLNDSLVNLVGDFAQIVSEEEILFNFCANLAETNTSLAEDVFRKESEKSKQKIQNIISYVFLSFSAAGHNYNSLSRDQLGKAIYAMEHGNVEVTSGHKIAGDLLIFGLAVPRNVRNLVRHSAEESMKYGERAFFKRMENAAKIAFDVL